MSLITSVTSHTIGSAVRGSVTLRPSPLHSYPILAHAHPSTQGKLPHCIQVLIHSLHRPSSHGQQHGVLNVAAGEYDQSEKLLHVRCLFIFLIASHSSLVLALHRILQCKMVGRKVLDGLRKGTKDVYALNIQYVRRYCLPDSCYAVSKPRPWVLSHHLIHNTK